MKARSYTEIETVEIDGVKFRLGWVPHGKMRLALLAAQSEQRKAQRRALLKLKADGDPNPAADLVKDEVGRDPAWVESLERYEAEVVAWGVRGHEGLLDTEGSVVPFAGVTREYMGRTFEGASDAMVAVYADVPGLLPDLYVRISERNALSEQKKSVSPPPQESTTESSTAGTV